MALAAGAAIAAAAAVSVVSAAFALYALVMPWTGSAGAGAIVAAVAALVVAVAGVMAKNRAEARRHHRGPARGAEPDASMVSKIIDIAKERPMLAAGAALAAGVYAIRHPALIAAVLGAVMENRSSKSD